VRTGRDARPAEGERALAATRDTQIAARLCGWFWNNARQLPWRTPPGQPRDAYAALVSEVMLQQTQVSRVVEKFGPFLDRFDSVQALAAAPEGEVLAAWSGMGYYRRARNLQAAARAIVERHGGLVPGDVKALRALPGIGRYTAGAIASIVFGRAVATVDGNIARVLLRVEGRELEAAKGVLWAWTRAEQLMAAVAGCDTDQRDCCRARSRHIGGRARRTAPGVLNEALMELGATVCTPRLPRCGECPLRGMCQAAAEARQERIPRPKVQRERPVLHCASVVLEDGRGRVLVEQRGERGMWAGLWQAPTLECGQRPARRADLERVMGLPRGVLAKVGAFSHATTHRDVRFVVWKGEPLTAADSRVVLEARTGAEWKPRAAIARLGLSNAQRKVLFGVSSALTES
jgi:A/G-specific adenine glycosylase